MDGARFFINLSGDFELSDGRVGSVAHTPELEELNSFIGAMRDCCAEDGFTKAFSKIARDFRKEKRGELRITTCKSGDSLVHSFAFVDNSVLTMEQIDKLLTKHGWSLDCESPFEISEIDNPSSVATGEAARLVLAYLQNTF